MEQGQIPALLEGLRSRKPQEAWEQFLREYSSSILRVIRFSERDPDHIADCFLFICEQFSRNGFRRLCQFRPDGPATFPTWLRAVVRHLYLDWHRQKFGRYRLFQSVARLSGFEQTVFQLLYEQGVSQEESFLHLTALFPGTTKELFIRSIGHIQQVLSSRQHWLLSLRTASISAAKGRENEDEVSLAGRIQDGLPNPEELAARQEERSALLRALYSLAPRERLVIRLRFEQELTLDQVAQAMKLGDPQSADRYIRHVLEVLRKQMTR